MKHMRIEIGFGVAFNRHNEPISLHAVADTMPLIREETAKQFGGCFQISGKGAWCRDSVVLDEYGYVIVIYAEDTETNRMKAGDLAHFIGQRLNQEAVCLAISDCDFEMVKI